MGDKGSIEKDTGIVVGKGALASVSAALAAYVTSNSFVAAGVSGAVVALGEVMADRYQGQRREHATTWWETVLHDDTRTPDGVADEVRARLEDPKVADAVLRSLRSALDARDGAAVVPLARLAKEYVGGSRPVDAFFRGTVRMFAESDAADVEGLREVVRAADELAVDVTLAVVDEDEDDLRVILRDVRGGVTPPDFQRIRKPIDAFRMVHLLRAHGLAREPNLTGAIGATIPRSTVQRLKALLGES